MILAQTKIREDGCIEWAGNKDDYGYGMITGYVNSHRVHRVHRAMWELTHRPLKPGECICHKCDNTSCVRPDHLFVGSQADNNHDMMKKGRNFLPPARGKRENLNRKLDREKAKEIKKLFAEGHKQPEIAKLFGVHVYTVSRIVRGILWRNA